MAPRVKEEASTDSPGLGGSTSRKKRKKGKKVGRKKKNQNKNDDPNACEARNVTRAALRYKPSKRMAEISQRAAITLSDKCKTLIEITQNLDLSNPTNKTKRLLTKKELHCPDLLTNEERNVLMTPGGIRKTALNYKFTRRMVYLSLPAWRFLKDRKDDEAKRWKAFILEENERRGKQVWAEKMRKAEMKRRRQEEKRQKRKEEKAARASGGEKAEDEGAPKIEKESAEDEDNEEAVQPEGGPEKDENDRVVSDEKQETKDDESTAARTQKPVQPKDEYVWEEDEEAAKRRAARNAWRFAPSPCKKNPFGIKRSALKGKVSPRMAELAIRTLPKALTCKKDPFGVKRSALKGPVSSRYEVLARPTHPRDPIERPPPREKDSFGRPIYAKPVYGRKIPDKSPIKRAICPDKQKKDDAEESKEKPTKRRFIDPIVWEPTIDPCIDPDRAKRQMKARKAAKEEFKRRLEAKKEKPEKSEAKPEETSPEEKSPEETSPENTSPEKTSPEKTSPEKTEPKPVEQSQEKIEENQNESEQPELTENE